MSPRLPRLRRKPRLGRDFNCADQASANWDERAFAAVALLRGRLARDDEPERRLVIGDLGAGNERLRRILADDLALPHEYHSYDVSPQQPSTTKIDLEHETPSLAFDAVFCLGLLEYLHDPSEFLTRLGRVSRFAVLSYVVFDGEERLSVSERRERGWLSDLTKDAFAGELSGAGFRPTDSAVVNRGRTNIWLAERDEMGATGPSVT